jgi:hypothetical protein
MVRPLNNKARANGWGHRGRYDIMSHVTIKVRQALSRFVKL